MTFEQLQYFLMIRKYLSFSSAADELNITQSALSKQIKSLEAELNTPLFDRKTRSISLTVAGVDFAGYAEKIMANYNEMIANMKKHTLLEKGYLSIATIPVMSQYGVISKIAGFAHQFPHIKLDLIEKENDIILSMFRNGEVDIAFMRTNYIPEGFADVYPLIDDRLALVVSRDHPLANRDSIDLSLTRSEKFILLNSTSGIYDTCLKECEKAGFSPNVLYTNSRIETIIELVAESLGVTLLMERVVSYFNHSKLRIIPLTIPVTSSLAIVKPKYKQATDSSQAFIQHMITSYNGKR